MELPVVVMEQLSGYFGEACLLTLRLVNRHWRDALRRVVFRKAQLTHTPLPHEHAMLAKHGPQAEVLGFEGSLVAEDYRDEVRGLLAHFPNIATLGTSICGAYQVHHLLALLHMLPRLQHLRLIWRLACRGDTAYASISGLLAMVTEIMQLRSAAGLLKRERATCLKTLTACIVLREGLPIHDFASDGAPEYLALTLHLDAQQVPLNFSFSHLDGPDDFFTSGGFAAVLGCEYDIRESLQGPKTPRPLQYRLHHFTSEAKVAAREKYAREMEQADAITLLKGSRPLKMKSVGVAKLCLHAWLVEQSDLAWIGMAFQQLQELHLVCVVAATATVGRLPALKRLSFSGMSRATLQAFIRNSPLLETVFLPQDWYPAHCHPTPLAELSRRICFRGDPQVRSLHRRPILPENFLLG